jgi:cell wall-associated NlpC family hydrolase
VSAVATGTALLLGRALRRAAVVVTVLLATLAGSLTLSAGGAGALTLSRARHAAVHLAADQQGKPYAWGADGPGAFDCSGLVYYVYHRRLGVRLPRTANEQWHATRHVRKSHVHRGDLVFFLSGGHAYHVGIYAGHHRLWHAPYPGSHVRLQRIWTSAWRPGRVG